MTTRETSAGAPPILGWGEVALRTRDLDRASRFYCDVLGLTVFAEFDAVRFLKIADGAPGRPQLLVLFDADAPSTREGHGWRSLDPSSSPLHHVALMVSAADLGRWADRLRAAGVAMNERRFDWVGWRSLFFEDPDGNVVELVAAER